MKKYRVEFNFGSKYFDNAAEAFSYFEKSKKKNRNISIWLMTLRYIKKSKRISITQELLDYSFTDFSKGIF